MKCKSLLAQIDALNEEYLQVWEDLASIESPTSFKEGVDAACAYVIEWAKKKGFTVETFPQPVSGDPVCITMNPDSKECPVVLSGHMDTVHPVGFFGTPAVRHDEEKIYGPGVNDCKGGIAASMLAMDALQRCGYTKRPVQLLIQTDEEVGSKISKKQTIGWICEKAKNAVAFLNTEPQLKGKAVIERKGIARYQITVQGKAAHSSLCDSGANAIAQAAHMILELEKFKDRENGITCNCGIISGGSTPNTVPESCTFIADIRYVNDAQQQTAQDKIDQLCRTAFIPGCSATWELMSYRVSMTLCQRNLDLLAAVNEIFAQEGLNILEAGKSFGGADAADATAAGIPCLDCLGVWGGNNHSRDEFSYLNSLAESAKFLGTITYCI